MKSLKMFVLGAVAFGTVFAAVPAHAATFPLSNIEVLIKSVANGMVTIVSSDKNGVFSAYNKADGQYDLYVGDENGTPARVSSKNGVITGRIVILTDGTETKDPPAPKKPALKPSPKKTSLPLINR